jgi:hypothetical protein
MDRSSNTEPMLRNPKMGFPIKLPRNWAKANIKKNSAMPSKSMANIF